MSDLSNRMREIAINATVAPSQGPEVCEMSGMDHNDQPRHWRCALGDGTLLLCAEIEDLELKLRAIREWCDRVDFEQKTESRDIYLAKREGAMAIAHFIDSGTMGRYVAGLRRDDAAQEAESK